MKAFLSSLTIGVILTIIFFYFTRNEGLVIKKINSDIFLTEQIEQKDVRLISRRSIKTIIDFRPDGEVVHQPSSSEMKMASNNYGLKFVYIPVPHGDVPDRAIEELNNAINESPKPILMYCRSGKRAIRTYGLMLASQNNGPSNDEILKLITEAGFDDAEIENEIKSRISKRNTK